MNGTKNWCVTLRPLHSGDTWVGSCHPKGLNYMSCKEKVLVVNDRHKATQGLFRDRSDA
jgi:hypothetical protein